MSAVPLAPVSPGGEALEVLLGDAVTVVDLTAPLSESTPIICLPPERGQPWPFSREQIM